MPVSASTHLSMFSTTAWPLYIDRKKPSGATEYSNWASCVCSSFGCDEMITVGLSGYSGEECAHRLAAHCKAGCDGRDPLSSYRSPRSASQAHAHSSDKQHIACQLGADMYGHKRSRRPGVLLRQHARLHGMGNGHHPVSSIQPRASGCSMQSGISVKRPSHDTPCWFGKLWHAIRCAQSA